MQGRTDGDERTLGYPATEHGEKKDKEEYTTSVAWHIFATDEVYSLSCHSFLPCSVAG